MNQNDSNELKERADNGDFEASLNYAICIFDNNYSGRQCLYDEAFDYFINAFQFILNNNSSLSNQIKELLSLYFRKIWDHSSEIKKKYDANDINICINFLESVLYIGNFNGNHFNHIEALNRYLSNKFPNNEKYKNLKDQKQNDILWNGKNIIKDIDLLKAALVNEIPYFIKRINDQLGIIIADDDKSFLKNVNIEFSYFKKQDKYIPSIYKLKKMIGDLKKSLAEMDINEQKRISDILNKIEELLDENITLDEQKINIIKCLINETEISDNNINQYRIIRKIDDALKVSTYITYGEYDENLNKITLYLSNIYDKCSTCSINSNLFVISTFIHELFHAYHFKYINMDIKDSNKNDEEIVIESLASYFEYNYYLENIYKSKDDYVKNSYKKVQENISKSWDMDMFVYPYAAGLYFYKYNIINKRDSLYKKVFDLSLKSTKKSFELIKVFYDLDVY